uniref:HECT domain-containing protein n=1 Tax=Strigamia maritima TaxID=126957 RepID=T1IM89_STRMM
MAPLFVQRKISLTRNKFRSFFEAYKFHDDCTIRDEEYDAVYVWEKFLVDIETKKFPAITFETVLHFMTGMDSEPPSGFIPPLKVNFFAPSNEEEQCYPYAQVCDNAIYLPRGRRDCQPLLVEAVQFE